MDELPVPPLDVLRRAAQRQVAVLPADVLPLPVAEMDFALAPPVAEALRDGGRALRHRLRHGRCPTSARRWPASPRERWGWEIDPAAVARGGRRRRRRGRAAPRAHPARATGGDQPAGVPAVLPLGARGRRPAASRCRWRTRTAAGGSTSPRWSAAFADAPGGLPALQPAQPGRPGAHPRRAGRAGPAGRAGYGVTHGQRRDPRAAGAARRDVHAAADRAGRGRGRGQPALGQQGVQPGRAQVRRRRHRLAARWPRSSAGCPPTCAGAIGHFGVLATVAAFTDGGAWLDRLLAHARPPARASSAGCWPSGCPTSAGARRRRPTWPGWTAARSAPATRPASCLERGRVALEPGTRFGAARRAGTCGSTSAPARRSSTRRSPGWPALSRARARTDGARRSGWPARRRARPRAPAGRRGARRRSAARPAGRRA